MLSHFLSVCAPPPTCLSLFLSLARSLSYVYLSYLTLFPSLSLSLALPPSVSCSLFFSAWGTGAKRRWHIATHTAWKRVLTKTFAGLCERARACVSACTHKNASYKCILYHDAHVCLSECCIRHIAHHFMPHTCIHCHLRARCAHAHKHACAHDHATILHGLWVPGDRRRTQTRVQGRTPLCSTLTLPVERPPHRSVPCIFVVCYECEH
jgi:hypothetical protein